MQRVKVASTTTSSPGMKSQTSVERFVEVIGSPICGGHRRHHHHHHHHVSSCSIILIPQSFFIMAIFFNSFSTMHTLWLPATTSFSQPEKRMEAQDWKDVNPLPRSYGHIWSIEFNEWMNSKPRLDLNLDQLDTYRNKQLSGYKLGWLPHLWRAMEYILCHLGDLEVSNCL